MISNTASETALINSNIFSIYIHCLMMGDELLLKHSPDKTQRLVMINSIYDLKYSVRNSLDKLKNIFSNLYSLLDDGRRASPET